MLISVFCPTKNRAKTFLPALFTSIKEQVIPSNWEIEWIVCDDGSDYQNKTELKKLLKSSGLKNKLIEHKGSKGVSQSRNDAYRACDGEYIIDMDDDDLLTNDAVFSRINHLREAKSLWSFTNAATVDEFGKIMIGKELIQAWNHNSLDKSQITKLLLNNKAWYWASTRTYKREALYNGGKFLGWDPKYTVAQDLDHWITLTNIIGPPVHLDKITTYWRYKEDSHGINGRNSGLQTKMINDIRTKWSKHL
jgi:glycosyltransferase involved in cell wall biosynthesis